MDRLRHIGDRHGLQSSRMPAHASAPNGAGAGSGRTVTSTAFSFYATKNITTIEGGAIVTKIRP